MRTGRPSAITKAVEKTIAELFFLAFTDAQVALYTGVNERTIRRARAGEFCPAIKKAEIAREMAYRQKVWDGLGNWCGVSWFLERKYPTQFAKPEVQLQINNNVLNQTNVQALVVQVDVAQKIGSRVKGSNSRVDTLFKAKGKLSPPKAENSGNGHSASPEAKSDDE